MVGKRRPFETRPLKSSDFNDYFAPLQHNIVGASGLCWRADYVQSETAFGKVDRAKFKHSTWEERLDLHP